MKKNTKILAKTITYMSLACWISVFYACDPLEQTSQKNRVDTTKTYPKLVNEIDIKVLEAENIFAESQIIEVKNDPVFHKTKRYEGVSLKKVLEKNFNLAVWDSTQTRIFFECKDKYIVSMRLGQALNHSGYLVFRDVDAPKGEKFLKARKGDEIKTLDPYYVVWTDATEKDHTFVWPYELQKIRLAVE